MRKIIIILAILFASVQTNGQQVSLNTNGKCDGITQVELQKMQRTKSGKEEIRLLAKVRDGFDARTLASQGITVGTKAGNIVTLRLPLNKLSLLQSSPDILQYSISQKIVPTMEVIAKNSKSLVAKIEIRNQFILFESGIIAPDAPHSPHVQGIVGQREA